MGFINDNKEDIKCPACGTQMRKIFLEGSNISVDICLDGCGGIYFDNRELEKFDEKHESADEIYALYQNKNFAKVDESQTRICPICNVPMVKLGGSSGSVVIDACHTCGAKFLDYGELERIRNEEPVNIDIDKFLGEQKPLTPNPRREFFENLVKKRV